ncbi:MAG: bifunctional diaminohydroxyphosphoribosylaminopyrimidine deaminase/5-amino-6-(5-phosphoribosylamino)uracil reductase RibD [Actinobacteria bacterium]|nr:bifunctional diaminohydroxyphosphoribosylaminopyrimidine deaminase/5-amino-6-(5-phosphoribosylamino)uracil reductase RibD [Actinomycetota bacterium]
MGEAIELAQSPDAPHGENPRVGCVILDTTGAVVGRGYHRGAGTPHAEVMALRDAGERARGATAVVTLEPCSHTGRTGPCTEALLAAGVARVVFAQVDPTSQAGGGAELLRAAGVDVIGGVRSDDAATINTAWTFAVRTGRPMVTWKSAVSLDGRVAGADGGPTPLTGAAARAQVHQLRADVDAIVVGTGTVLIDDPALTVRMAGHVGTAAPLRVVVGSRPIPADARVLDDSAPTLVIDEPDPSVLLTGLYSRGIRHVLLEGGPTLAAAFLAARVIDRIEWYIAPVLLGAGPVALPGMGSDPQAGVDVIDVSVVGEDVRIVGSVRYEGSEA